jgi:hypothetical protein
LTTIDQILPFEKTEKGDKRMAEWFPLPQHLTEPHPGHEAHLCMAENVGFVKNNLELYKEYVRNPQYVCKHCGRAAARAENLCDPDPL